MKKIINYSPDVNFEQINESNFFIDWKRMLGSGAFSKVYRGLNRQNNQHIAIKCVEKEEFKGKKTQLQRQCDIAENLSSYDHPNILSFYGHEEDNRYFYLFFEYCSGGTLEDVIRKKRISEVKAYEYFTQLIEVMTFLNGQNYIHRDLKPSNILLTQSDTLKIGDFGSSRQIENQMTLGRKRCTPLYSPPEFILSANQQYNETCDVWSAGLILYQLLMGRHLFSNVIDVSQLQKEVAKLKSPTFQMKIEKRNQWKQIIQRMLVFNYLQRAHFWEINQKLEDIKVFSSFLKEKRSKITEGLKILDRMNPFSKKQHLQPQVRERMVELYDKFNKLVKWTSFFFEKNKIHDMLRERFHLQNRNIHNVYKYLMMLLALSMFLVKTQDFIPEFNHEEVKVNNFQIIKFCDFQSSKEEVNIKKWFKGIKERLIKEQAESRSRIEKIKEKIKQYKLREKQRKMLIQHQSLIEQFLKDDINKPYNYYRQKYRQVVDKKENTLYEQQFPYCEKQNLITYAYMLLIRNLDEQIPNYKFMNGDEVNRRLEIISKQSPKSDIEKQILQLQNSYN